MRRAARGIAALVAAVVVCGTAGETRPDRPVPHVAALQSFWRPALGDAGPATADRLIERYTPACRTFESVAELARDIRDLRETMLSRMNLDPTLRPRSARVQRTLSRNGYKVEVIRLEAVRGVYLPINLYVPDGAKRRASPLVISPTGCGSATWSEHVQRRAANLALLGMSVIVAEGFCDNGARALLPDGRPPAPRTGYARQLLGLPGDTFGVFLQELMATIGWAVTTYDSIDPDRIGAAGYSYGGQVALLLAQADRRVRSLSIPATYLGDDCAAARPIGDIRIEAEHPDHLWSAPPELPVLPTNSRLVMLYPRPLHTISGRADPGAPPSVIGPAMDYAATLYALGGHGERLKFRADGGHHHYDRNRREGTYAWLAHTLLGRALEPVAEQPVTLAGRDELAVEIGGTRTMEAELAAVVERESRRRFRRGRPAGDVAERVASALSELFPTFTAQPLTAADAWYGQARSIHVKAHAYLGPDHAFPVFTFHRDGGPAGRPLLFLPRRGTFEELEAIRDRLMSRATVISIDYAGIGELKSDRLLTHTFARYFMHNDPSLPKMNVELLRSYLAAAGLPVVDVDARGWSSAMYALMLAALEPDRIGELELTGVPENELREIGSGGKIPDLLLWGGLFSKITAAELGEIVARDHGVSWIRE